jgi:hypothetical protein
LINRKSLRTDAKVDEVNQGINTYDVIGNVPLAIDPKGCQWHFGLSSRKTGSMVEFSLLLDLTP